MDEEIVETQEIEDTELEPEMELVDSYLSSKDLNDGLRVIDVDIEIKDGFVPVADNSMGISSSVLNSMSYGEIYENKRNTGGVIGFSSSKGTSPIQQILKISDSMNERSRLQDRLDDLREVVEKDRFWVKTSEGIHKMVRKKILTVSVLAKNGERYQITRKYEDHGVDIKNPQYVEDKEKIEEANERGVLTLEKDGKYLELSIGRLSIKQMIQKSLATNPMFIANCIFASGSAFPLLMYTPFSTAFFGQMLLTSVFLFMLGSQVRNAQIETENISSDCEEDNLVTVEQISNLFDSNGEFRQINIESQDSSILFECDEIDAVWEIERNQEVLSERGVQFLDKIDLDEIDKTMILEVSKSRPNDNEKDGILVSEDGDWTLRPTHNESS